MTEDNKNNYMISFSEVIFNDLILGQIQGLWNRAAKNYSNTNSVTKLWQITQIIVLIFCLNSCVETTTSRRASPKESNTCVENDSLIFCQMLDQLEVSGYIYDSTFIKTGRDEQKKAILLDTDNKTLLSHLNYYRYVSFDRKKVVKPFCSIIQLSFDADTSALEYFKSLEIKYNNKNGLIMIPNVTFVTKSGKIIYLFSAMYSAYDSDMLDIKQKMDKIIKPSAKDLRVNAASLLNRQNVD